MKIRLPCLMISTWEIGLSKIENQDTTMKEHRKIWYLSVLRATSIAFIVVTTRVSLNFPRKNLLYLSLSTNNKELLFVESDK